ncbi:MAG: DUF434 domain-containing protein [Chthoniobacter sp.]|nr:DUF434 domain-containing protein [Chthoniobacter sp.]
MPDQRAHRGPNPKDAEAFAPEMLPRLREACTDLSWLLSHGYAGKSAATLVGDRYALTERQRIAVRRCACSDEQLRDRRHRQVILTTTGGELAGTLLEIDGYNALTTVEAALADGIILEGRDGCYRDMASMHGNFKKVAETPRAITLIGRTLARCAIRSAIWYLDASVSNSARLKQLLLEVAAAENWDWRVELVPDPDRILAVPPQDRGALQNGGTAIASADSAILDRTPRWFSLAREVVQEHGLTAHLISLMARQE